MCVGEGVRQREAESGRGEEGGAWKGYLHGFMSVLTARQEEEEDGQERLLLVGNTHLFYHPMAQHIRLMQVGRGGGRERGKRNFAFMSWCRGVYQAKARCELSTYT